MLKQLVKFAGVTAAAIIMQHFAMIAAFAERGYQAMGSEILVFPFVMVVGGLATGLIHDEVPLDWEDEDDEEGAYYYEADEERRIGRRY